MKANKQKKLKLKPVVKKALKTLDSKKVKKAIKHLTKKKILKALTILESQFPQEV